MKKVVKGKTTRFNQNQENVNPNVQKSTMEIEQILKQMPNTFVNYYNKSRNSKVDKQSTQHNTDLSSTKVTTNGSLNIKPVDISQNYQTFIEDQSNYQSNNSQNRKSLKQSILEQIQQKQSTAFQPSLNQTQTNIQDNSILYNDQLQLKLKKDPSLLNDYQYVIVKTKQFEQIMNKLETYEDIIVKLQTQIKQQAQIQQQQKQVDFNHHSIDLKQSNRGQSKTSLINKQSQYNQNQQNKSSINISTVLNKNKSLVNISNIEQKTSIELNEFQKRIFENISYIHNGKSIVEEKSMNQFEISESTIQDEKPVPKINKSIKQRSISHNSHTNLQDYGKIQQQFNSYINNQYLNIKQRKPFY